MSITKKSFLITLVFLFILSSLFVSADASSYVDVNDEMYYSDAIESLTRYGVISGYNGNFRPDAKITRAEFSKVIALVSGLEDQVYSNAGNKKFDDVPLYHWATGYINTVANNKIIIGYPDGKYKPENNITYAEAVTVILRTLDYSTAELGDNWPYAYMIKAKGLGLTDELNVIDNNPITRADLCVIIDRALRTKLNNSSDEMISKMDFSITDEILVVATHKEDSSLSGYEISTNSGTYTLADLNLEFEPMSDVKLVLNKDKEVVNFIETKASKRTNTTVEGVINGEVYFSNGSSTIDYGISGNTKVYKNGALTSLGNIINDISKGSAVSLIYDKNGAVRYLSFGNADYTEAVAIRKDIYTTLNSVGVSDEQIKTATVIRNGNSANLSDAKVYDVVYYLEDNNTIYLYSDKVSGVYNEAFPSKNNVTSVEISGNVLELETQTAAYKLGEKSGSYKYGEKVTALLGMDGKVVDIVDLNSSSSANYGILLSYSTEISEDIDDKGALYRYITVINGEGKTSKYKTTGNYSERIGDVGKLSYDDNGNAVFASIASESIVSGKIDKNNRKIGDKWLTSDCVIIERTYSPDTRSGTATARTIRLEDINTDTLSAMHVLLAVTSGDFGDISLLILDSVTNDQFTYGILKSISGSVTTSNSNGNYEVFANGQTKSYSASFYQSLSSGTPVALQIENNKLVSIKKLNAIDVGVSVSAIDFSRIKVGKNIYKLSDDVQIIRKSSSGYTNISISNASEIIGKTANLYSDTTLSSGGTIRVITINN